MSKIIDAILYARDLPWTQRSLARDKNRLRVGWDTERAVSFCLRGQELRAASRLSLTEIEISLLENLVTEGIGGRSRPFWSDDPSRTQSDIDNMWDEVLRLAKERNL